MLKDLVLDLFYYLSARRQNFRRTWEMQRIVLHWTTVQTNCHRRFKCFWLYEESFSWRDSHRQGLENFPLLSNSFFFSVQRSPVQRRCRRLLWLLEVCWNLYPSHLNWFFTDTSAPHCPTTYAPTSSWKRESHMQFQLENGNSVLNTSFNRIFFQLECASKRKRHRYIRQYLLLSTFCSREFQTRKMHCNVYWE